MTHNLNCIYIDLDSSNSDKLNSIRAIAEQCGLKIKNIKERGSSTNVYLEWNEILMLHTGVKGQKPMSFDFDSQISDHIKKNYAFSKEPLYKALGLKKEKNTLVLDGTCGTAKDSLLMLSFGASVLAFERNPVAYALLKDAWENMANPIREKFEIRFGDCRKNNKSVDVIFFDPMYRDKNKKALSRKEMQIFEEVIGSDEDQNEVLLWALSKATGRVVLKKAVKSPLIEKPDNSYKGKSTRYDVWFKSQNGES